MDETHQTSIELNSLFAESENISTNANRRPEVKPVGNNKFYIEDSLDVLLYIYLY